MKASYNPPLKKLISDSFSGEGFQVEKHQSNFAFLSGVVLSSSPIPREARVASSSRNIQSSSCSKFIIRLVVYSLPSARREFGYSREIKRTFAPWAVVYSLRVSASPEQDYQDLETG